MEIEYSVLLDHLNNYDSAKIKIKNQHNLFGLG